MEEFLNILMILKGRFQNNTNSIINYTFIHMQKKFWMDVPQNVNGGCSLITVKI